MEFSVLDKEWQLLEGFLPSNWKELAHSERAIRRQRGITDAGTLLRVILLHVATGLSLRQASARATASNLAKITDVGLLKRLRTSEAWLRALTAQMYGESRFNKVFKLPTKRRLRAVDATTVEEPGSTGTDWRVHYSIALPSAACDFYEVTDNKGGETYKRIPIEKEDILLGDRGYSHREGVAYVLNHGGDVIVRMNSASFPLLTLKGNKFFLLTHLRQLKGYEPREWKVQFKANGQYYQARLCALRKSQIAAEQAKEKIKKVASKKGKAIRPETLEFAEYIFILTTISKKEIKKAGDILQLYRLRWQIELVFKRLKSLLRLGHVPKQNDLSARAWIQAKLLTVLIIERLLREAHFFSPWGFKLIQEESMA